MIFQVFIERDNRGAAHNMTRQAIPNSYEDKYIISVTEKLGRN